MKLSNEQLAKIRTEFDSAENARRLTKLEECVPRLLAHIDELKARVTRAIDRGIEGLPPNADASDFIRIQAAAGLENLYGA